MRTARGSRLRRDDGVVVLIVALLAVALLVIAGMVVDLGDARQQRREAAAAADAGALAGAEALNLDSPSPSECQDANCAAAYYAAASANSTPVNIASFASGRTPCAIRKGETCWQYSSGDTTVDVTHPFALDGVRANEQLVHVNICWSTSTSFGGLIGVNSIEVCGSATAENTAYGVPPGDAGPPTTDCFETDNFATAKPEEAATVYTFKSDDYPDLGKPIDFDQGHQPSKHDQVIVAWFHGFGADIDLDAIRFEAPTTTTGPLGTNALLPPIEPTDNHGPDSPQAKGIGYVVQSLDAEHQVQRYAPGGTFDVLIAYHLPDDAHLKVDGKTFTYTATLHAQPVAAEAGQCGNASWTFTHDGKNLASGGSSCGENSFWAFTPEPNDGTASPGTRVRGFYTDESTIQEKDVTDPSWPSDANYGIDFSITDLAGNTTQIPPSKNLHTAGQTDGYTITRSVAPHIGKERFNFTIEYILPGPDDPNPLPNGGYTVFLKAYDTDNNKPGNDCGVFTWSFLFTGAGDISLVQ